MQPICVSENVPFPVQIVKQKRQSGSLLLYGELELVLDYQKSEIGINNVNMLINVLVSESFGYCQ